MIREPTLLPSLIMAVLTSAIDTEGNLPEELTAQPERHASSSRGMIRSRCADTFSGPRYTGPMGAAALFSPLASIVNILVRNPMAPVRIESIDCDVEIEPGRKVASIESVRLLSDTIEPGQDLKAFVTLKPFKGEREVVEIVLPIPADFPEGPARGGLLRPGRQHPPPVPQRAAPGRAARPASASCGRSGCRPSPSGPRSSRTSPAPERGLAVQGQELPNLPGSVRAVFASKKEIPVAADPVGPDRSRPPARPGSSRDPVAPVHGGQGRRALVIVEVTGLGPGAQRETRRGRHGTMRRGRIGVRLVGSWRC